MQKLHVLITLFIFLSVSPAAKAQTNPNADAGPEDKKVIAVLEILELMEMLDDIAFFKDMEYLNEGDPNEPQD